MAAQMHCKTPVAPKGKVALAAESVLDVLQCQCHCQRQRQQDIVIRGRDGDTKVYVPRPHGLTGADAAVVVWEDTALIAR